MIPIKITGHLLCGAAFNPGEGLTLDGPLLWACVLDRLGADALASPSAAEIADATSRPAPDMPLAVHEQDGDWCYCVSAGEWPEHYGTEVTHWHKRFDDANAQILLERGALDMGRTTKVNTGSGEFKAYRMPLYTELVDRVEWYAVGDPERVRSLLSRHIRAVGKKHNRGHGTVTHWDVEPWDGAADRWMWRAPDVPARPLPVGWLSDWRGEVAYAAVRPPAWLPTHQTLCAVS